MKGAGGMGMCWLCWLQYFDPEASQLMTKITCDDSDSLSVSLFQIGYNSLDHFSFVNRPYHNYLKCDIGSCHGSSSSLVQLVSPKVEGRVFRKGHKQAKKHNLDTKSNIME